MTHHSSWFHDTSTEVLTADGKPVKIIDFLHQDDEAILKLWAKHFREHYIPDTEIDGARTPMRLSRSDYLKDIKFPSKPHVRSGDFSEILVADYIEFVLNYLVPRTRYDNKLNRDTSPYGVDVIGFKFVGDKESRKDELFTCEVKGSLATKTTGRFQEAIDHSKKDFQTRIPEALNAMRQRLKDKGKLDLVQTVERFQDKTSHPYKAVTGAALVCSDHCWTDDSITVANSTHPNSNLYLFAIKGNLLMDLANRLYELAYATA